MLSVTIVLLRAVYTLFKRPLGCPKHIYPIVKVKMVVKEAVKKKRKFVQKGLKTCKIFVKISVKIFVKSFVKFLVKISRQNFCKKGFEKPCKFCSKRGLEKKRVRFSF